MGWSHAYGPFFAYDKDKAMKLAKDISQDARMSVAVLEWSGIDTFIVCWDSTDG